MKFDTEEEEDIEERLRREEERPNQEEQQNTPEAEPIVEEETAPVILPTQKIKEKDEGQHLQEIEKERLEDMVTIFAQRESTAASAAKPSEYFVTQTQEQPTIYSPATESSSQYPTNTRKKDEMQTV